MIQAAGPHLHDDFACCGPRLGHFAKFKFPGRSLGNKLNGFHTGNLTQRKQRTQSFVEKN